MGCAASASSASSPVVPFTGPEEFHSKYALAEKIGKGAYAQVHLAQIRKKPNGAIAVKVRNLHSTQSLNTRDKKVCISAYKEVCLWSHVGRHRNCVNLHESFFDDHLCYMVMEKCSEGLMDHIHQKSTVSEKSLSEIFSQMLQGIAHIHSSQLVHRDIKPDNFLVQYEGKLRATRSVTVKLADFGLAAYVPVGEKVEGVCGTSPYMCPEMLLKREVDVKADVWSLGVIAYLLLTGKFPYTCRDGTARSMKLAIAEGERVRCERSWLTPTAASFMTALLERDPSLRSSAAVALEMPFIVDSHRNAESTSTNLKAMLVAAGKTGAFDAPDLTNNTIVDALLNEMQKGMIERTTRVLSPGQIQEFIGASPAKMDQLVDAFWLSGFGGSCTSSNSTNYASSPGGSFSAPSVQSRVSEHVCN